MVVITVITITLTTSSSITVISGFMCSKAVLCFEDSPTAVDLAGILAVKAVVVTNGLNSKSRNVSTSGGGAGKSARVVKLENVVCQRVM